MKFNNTNHLTSFIIKKFIISGKIFKSLKIKKYLKILEKQNLLSKAISELILPVKFNSIKLGYSQHYIPVLAHYYISYNLALKWLIKGAKVRSFKKMPFIKALCLECLDVLKKQGNAYKYKEHYLKKALANRIYVHLLSGLKNKI